MNILEVRQKAEVIVRPYLFTMKNLVILSEASIILLDHLCFL